MRKVIQIIKPQNESMRALCDDGSMWMYNYRWVTNTTHEGASSEYVYFWQKIDDIPQDEVVDDPSN